MADCDVWTPIVGTGTEDDPYRPDVPDGIAWRSREGLPVELNAADANYGRPANRYACVTVDEADAGKIAAAVPGQEVPLEERMLVALCRTKRRAGPTSAKEEAAVETIFRDEAAAGLTAPVKETFGRLLVRMARRGLSVAAAAAIIKEHNLDADAVGRNR
jgi:hypothetical protein